MAGLAASHHPQLGAVQLVPGVNENIPWEHWLEGITLFSGIQHSSFGGSREAFAAHLHGTRCCPMPKRLR